MTQTPHTIVKTLVLLSLFLFLSGCADKINYGTVPKGGSQEITENTSLVEPDEELQNTDSEMCSDPELSALNQTGIWGEPYSPMSFDPTENVSFDFPVVLNKQVEMYLHFFQNGFRKQFSQWLQRSAAYMPIMEASLAEAGLPRELVYLAMIESGYNPLACSRSKAVGLWQFMEGTGLQYNLAIDKYIDERRDPEKSTQAAVAFLADLYKEFGDWHLAVAAYNGGPGKIRNGLTKYNVNNFWELAGKDYLALETKRYVPKLIAALIIAKQPERFGFSELDYDNPPRYDVIAVGPGMGLEAVALITNSSTEKIKQLNHELRQNKTPPNVTSYEVKVPLSTAALAIKNMPRLHSIVTTAYKTHKTRKGDTLTSICSRYDVNKTTLLKANNLTSGNLSSGQRLRIPYNTIAYQLLPENIAKKKAANLDNMVIHQVKPGDTVSRISKLYNVPSELIISWNNLKNVKSMQIGQQLALYIDQRNTIVSVEKTPRVESEKIAGLEKAPKLVLKAEKRKAHVTEVRADDSYASYNVQGGDTLYTISQKFSASTSEIKKWNNLKSDLIHPGNILKLKKV
ncbi:MAG: LysM peptidoglycan-binding domain-containing protein [Proteobacteria bacterium]|nr:LysM peptidoglycan-binding domain-containing protein [Pseudomonadota bacterium]